MNSRIFLAVAFLVLGCGCQNGTVHGEQTATTAAVVDSSAGKAAAPQTRASLKPLIGVLMPKTISATGRLLPKPVRKSGILPIAAKEENSKESAVKEYLGKSA